MHLSPTFNSALEIKGIKINWKSKDFNIFNLHHPPGQGSTAADLSTIFSSGTVTMGDINAKHSAWGSTTVDHRSYRRPCFHDFK